ncbi:hypothetical protein JCM10207_007277 [Rhodosporidiobolus poonsookiae]
MATLADSLSRGGSMGAVGPSHPGGSTDSPVQPHDEHSARSTTGLLNSPTPCLRVALALRTARTRARAATEALQAPPVRPDRRRERNLVLALPDPVERVLRARFLLHSLSLFALPTLAAHSHLFPPRNALHLRSHHAHPALRPSPRQLLKQRQAVAPPSSAVAAAQQALHARQVERQLRALRRRAEPIVESVERLAERVRRAAGGAGGGSKIAVAGQAMHDNLYELLQLLVEAQSPSFATSSSRTATDTVALAAHPAAAQPARASPSPVPSGAARSKRSTPTPLDPTSALLLLHSTTTYLTRALAATTATLPFLRAQLRESLAALMEEVEGEVRSVEEGAVQRLGLGGMRTATGLSLLDALDGGLLFN